ncbi:MAG: hypothetical protein CMC08_02370 [Flavobacteriaceae bacterium]|nr:hypothetical protein [Flavobacteriaceae bacterium]
MKKLLIIVLLLPALALSQDDRHERIKALKTAYITEALSFTPEEAEQFWPVYNSYQEQMHALRNAEREEIHRNDKNGVEGLSLSEAKRLVDQLLDYERREWELEKTLMANLQKIMSPKKIVLLKISEEKFKRRLLERYKRGKE